MANNFTLVKHYIFQFKPFFIYSSNNGISKTMCCILSKLNQILKV